MLCSFFFDQFASQDLMLPKAKCDDLHHYLPFKNGITNVENMLEKQVYDDQPYTEPNGDDLYQRP